MFDFLAGRRLGTVAALCLTCLTWLLATDQALAQPLHRARLGADLQQRLAEGAATIDVIVQKNRGEVEALARRYNLQIRRHLKSGAVLRLTAGQLEALQQDSDVETLSSDLPVRSSAVIAGLTIGADQLWDGKGALRPRHGNGVGVAVIDSGIDYRHPGLASRVAISVDFTGGDGIDRFGHGTHVAGLIAGAAGSSTETAAYHGIAPGAHLVNLRVLDEHGAGTASDVMEAIDWAIEHQAAYNIRVINLSLGGPVVQSYRDDPMCKAVERAVAAGIVVIAAAGNVGLASDGRSVYGAVTTPGNDPHVITVGALDTKGTAGRSDDEVAAFSSKGPTRYDLVLKPDLVAPGTRVISTEAAGSYLSTTGRAARVAGSDAEGYVALSGTSMSAAVVSGAVALLIEGSPELTPARAKALVQFTSSFMPESGLAGSGAGSIDIARAALRDVELVASRGSGRMSGGNQVTNCVERQPSPVPDSWLKGPETLASTSFFDSIVWGNSAFLASNVFDSIVWGNAWAPASIVWGNSWGFDSIVWGNFWAPDSIVWGNAWGHDSIVWGNSWSPDSIVWGNSWATDSIVWGNTNVLWSAFDSIAWDNSDMRELPRLGLKSLIVSLCSAGRQ